MSPSGEIFFSKDGARVPLADPFPGAAQECGRHLEPWARCFRAVSTQSRLEAQHNRPARLSSGGLGDQAHRMAQMVVWTWVFSQLLLGTVAGTFPSFVSAGESFRPSAHLDAMNSREKECSSTKWFWSGSRGHRFHQYSSFFEDVFFVGNLDTAQNELLRGHARIQYDYPETSLDRAGGTLLDLQHRCFLVDERNPGGPGLRRRDRTRVRLDPQALRGTGGRDGGLELATNGQHGGGVDQSSGAAAGREAEQDLVLRVRPPLQGGHPGTADNLQCDLFQEYATSVQE